MRLSRTFSNRRFPEAVIRRAIEVIGAAQEKGKPAGFLTLKTARGLDRWNYDDPNDFFAGYPDAETAGLYYGVTIGEGHINYTLSYSFDSRESIASVEAESISQINAVMNVFQGSLAEAIPIESESVPETMQAQIRVFIGHGRSKAWEELKNHLQDKHQYDVVAFESGARAGHHIRDILEEMLDRSSTEDVPAIVES